MGMKYFNCITGLLLFFSVAHGEQNLFFVNEGLELPSPVEPIIAPAKEYVPPEEVVSAPPSEVVVETPRPADPKAVVFKFSGRDWRSRSYKDYGFTPYSMAVTPSWEKRTPAPWKSLAASYTQYAAFIIDHFGADLLNGPHEFTRNSAHCPAYNSLSRKQRVEFWVHFMSAMTFPESGFKPKVRMKEKSFRNPDPITKEPVYSEGLLQLSYQDMRSYPEECRGAFDWESDKKISRTSDNKTIFDPMRNLYCGIRILNRNAKKRKSVIYDKNQYWAVLMPNGRYSKVNSILKQVSAQNPACHGKSEAIAVYKINEN